MKNKKRFHIEISTTSNGISKTHKFSDIALQFLADKINENKDDPNWLQSVADDFRINSKKITEEATNDG